MRNKARQFPSLMADVEKALDQLAEADEAIEHATAHLNQMREARVAAVAELARCRESLFKTFPELAVSPAPASSDGGVVPSLDPARPGFEAEPLEVDDEGDFDRLEFRERS